MGVGLHDHLRQVGAVADLDRLDERQGCTHRDALYVFAVYK